MFIVSFLTRSTSTAWQRRRSVFPLSLPFRSGTMTYSPLMTLLVSGIARCRYIIIIRLVVRREWSSKMRFQEVIRKICQCILCTVVFCPIQCVQLHWKYIIGASLSKPHASVTSLCCVCDCLLVSLTNHLPKILYQWISLAVHDSNFHVHSAVSHFQLLSSFIHWKTMRGSTHGLT